MTIGPVPRRGLWGVGGLLVAGVALGLAPAASTGAVLAPSAAARPGTSVHGCAVYPKDDIWNTDISSLPVDSHSADWLSHMSPGSDLHPDFGPSYGQQPVPYGIPITYVDASHPLVPVHFTEKGESDKGPYPFGADTKIEGGAGAKGDRHALVVDTTSCTLYETYATRDKGGAWSAYSGAIWDLHSNHLRPDGWTSADAAGLPILAGLLRYHEVEVAHLVTHAIRFTTDTTQTAHLWPARHDAGSTGDPAYPPMGARFRLKASFPITGYRPDTTAILQAMQTYGMILADNGSAWYFQGEQHAHWPAAMLDQLKTIPASAFEAVDESSLQVSPNSGKARQPGQ
jgi:hypothetical protein